MGNMTRETVTWTSLRWRRIACEMAAMGLWGECTHFPVKLEKAEERNPCYRLNAFFQTVGRRFQ